MKHTSNQLQDHENSFYRGRIANMMLNTISGGGGGGGVEEEEEDKIKCACCSSLPN